MTDGIDNQLPPPGNGATPAAPEGRDKGEGDAPTAPQVSRILSSGEFIARRTPRIKLVEQIITRGWCYSLTAPTGHGKSSILLRLAYAVATGQPFGPYATKQARALYLVGENDGGVRSRRPEHEKTARGGEGMPRSGRRHGAVSGGARTDGARTAAVYRGVSADRKELIQLLR